MIIIYLGAFVEEGQEEMFVKSKTQIPTATTSFQRMLLSGIQVSEETTATLQIINAPDVGSYPLRSKKLFIPASEFNINGVSGINCSYINFTYIKGVFIYKSLLKALDKKCKNSQNETIVIVVYSVIYSYIKAAIEIKKKYHNVKICPIILDLPEYFGDSVSWISKILPDRVKKTHDLYPEFDGGIVLTKHMIKKLNLENKPTLLLEGVYRPQKNSISENKVPKSILYTGKLDSRFGIDVLLKAFSLIEDDEFELWIYGDGSARNIVEFYANRDHRIKYYGKQPQEMIFKAQKKASLLINPRQNIGEFTKYSFPSKTMEYLASGTPVIMYKLDGIPEEYDEFLIYPKDNSIMELSETLYHWGKKSEIELKTYGAKGRDFILKNKNSDVQVKKITNFIIQNYG